MKDKLNKIKHLANRILTNCRAPYDNGKVHIWNNFSVSVLRSNYNNAQVQGLEPYDNLKIQIHFEDLNEESLSEIIAKLQDYIIDYQKHESEAIEKRKRELLEELEELQGGEK